MNSKQLFGLKSCLNEFLEEMVQGVKSKLKSRFNAQVLLASAVFSGSESHEI